MRKVRTVAIAALMAAGAMLAGSAPVVASTVSSAHVVAAVPQTHYFG